MNNTIAYPYENYVIERNRGWSEYNQIPTSHQNSSFRQREEQTLRSPSDEESLKNSVIKSKYQNYVYKVFHQNTKEMYLLNKERALKSIETQSKHYHTLVFKRCISMLVSSSVLVPLKGNSCEIDYRVRTPTPYEWKKSSKDYLSGTSNPKAFCTVKSNIDYVVSRNASFDESEWTPNNYTKSFPTQKQEKQLQIETQWRVKRPGVDTEEQDSINISLISESEHLAEFEGYFEKDEIWAEIRDVLTFRTQERHQVWLRDERFFKDFLQLEMSDSSLVQKEEVEREMIKNFVEFTSKTENPAKESSKQLICSPETVEEFSGKWDSFINNLVEKNGKAGFVFTKQAELITPEMNEKISVLSDEKLEKLFKAISYNFEDLLLVPGWERILSEVVIRTDVGMKLFTEIVHSEPELFFEQTETQVYLIEILKRSEGVFSFPFMKPIFKYISENHARNSNSASFTKFCSYLVRRFEKEQLLNLKPMIDYLMQNLEVLFEKICLKRVYLLLLEKISNREQISFIFDRLKHRIFDLMKSKDANPVISLFIEHELPGFRSLFKKVYLKNFREIMTMKYSKFFLLKILQKEHGQRFNNLIFNEFRKIKK